MWLLVTSWPQRAPGTRPRIRVIDGGVFSKPPARRHYNLQGIFMKSLGTALAAHTSHCIVWIMLLGSTNIYLCIKSKASHFCWQNYCRSSKPGPGWCWWRVNVLPSARVHASAMKNICWLVPRLRRVWSRSSWWTRAGVRCSLPPIIAGWVFEHIWTNFMHVNHPFCDTLGTWEILIILQSTEQF